MTDDTHGPVLPIAPIPPDDLTRHLTVVSADDDGLTHIGLVGDTYTVLISGQDTGGRFCLIDMLIPPGGGPGPHRHDFEEMFTLLEGQLEFTFRGQKLMARAGQTVNVPANAPHFFSNACADTVHLLCLCAPAGQEEFFAAVGDRVATRTSVAPRLDGDALAQRLDKIRDLAPRYRNELLDP
ncbi:MAG: cupin domain-containing protein [Pseudonocardiales bacterium]|nr:cupin domain-containing protein [Pseudonocardiales bacterium]